jgi:hypothetical protein
VAPTEGVDLSRYDSATVDDTSAVDDPRANYVILNVEDPGFLYKAHHAIDIGKHWGPYSWLYAERGGAEAVERMMSAVDSVGSLPTRAGWVDYEANGVAPEHAAQARVRASSGDVPFKTGLYTYLYLLNSQGGLAQEWWQWTLRWLAYYPGSNDGTLLWGANGDAIQWGSAHWQYTSSGGTRDRNAVIDEALWATLGGAPAQSEEDAVNVYISKKSDPNQGIWITDGIFKRHVLPDEWAFVQYVSGGQTGVFGVSDQWWDSLPTASPTGALTLQDLVAIQNAVKPLLVGLPGSGGSAPQQFNLTLSGLAKAA